jgi:hypothetical protein
MLPLRFLKIMPLLHWLQRLQQQQLLVSMPVQTVFANRHFLTQLLHHHHLLLLTHRHLRLY